jgi:hypothetical protein
MNGDGPKFYDLTTSTGHAMTDAIAAGSILMQEGTHPPNSSPTRHLQKGLVFDRAFHNSI